MAITIVSYSKEVSFMESLSSVHKSLNLQYAFIDECGDYGLDFEKQDVSSYFFVTAVIVDEKRVPELEKKLTEIREKYFQGDEMKSSSVGSDDVKRIEILENICKLDFHVFCLIVDKRKVLKDSGLAYKESFIKYLNGIVHQELYTAYPKLQMIANEHESKEFMDAFIKYVYNNHQPTLFEYFDFSFSDSEVRTLIQLADFIGGTISRGYEESCLSDKFPAFMRLLKDKIVRLELWPKQLENYLHHVTGFHSIAFDESIFQQAVRSADLYIERNADSDIPEVQEQIIFLKYLKSMLVSQRPDLYISSKEILNNLNLLGKGQYNNHYFKTQIVAKLRDSGVIIASSPQGYKLPISEKELYDFVNQSSSMIMPMLNRLKKCREQVKLATRNELDIFEKPEYHLLKKYFDE